jgi:hypothetical protein
MTAKIKPSPVESNHFFLKRWVRQKSRNQFKTCVYDLKLRVL